MTAERACWVCHRRIHTAALTAMPDGRVVHLACYQKEIGPLVEAATREAMGGEGWGDL